jgi:hypothetical protein
VVTAWTLPPPSGLLCSHHRPCTQRSTVAVAASSDNDDWTNLPPVPDDDQNERTLGIDIGAMLDPLSEQEAAEMKAAATEIINDAVAAGLDDMDRLRNTMQQELAQARETSLRASERAAAAASQQLLNKIDTLTNSFLSTTASSRTSTKLAAAADQAAAANEQGVEMGSWGVLAGGAAVSLLGSVSSSSAATTNPQDPSQQQNHRILVLADTAADPYAKQLLEPLTVALKAELHNDLQVNVYKPTATVPLGGDNAAAVLLFCTSFTDPSTVKSVLDRVLRKTMQGGEVGQPPTQIVAISTVGTARIEKMPYSMQNMIGGGKLEKRRQMEEAVIRFTRDATRTTGPGLDYTICKLGELSGGNNEAFQFRAGDAVDGTLSVDTAVTVLTQAIALQPAARNATFSCVGKLVAGNDNDHQKILDDAFLRLDGPELLRFDLADSDKDYGQLVEYIKEWASMLAESGKGLTTPIRAETVSGAGKPMTIGVERQAAVKLLFLPTSTGKNYLSKEEERKTEKDAAAAKPGHNQRATSKEGGIEFVVEITEDKKMRVRAKRCNYGDDVVVKELSEETILSRFRKGIEVWKKDHQRS